MAVEQRRSRNGQLFWYSTLANFASESQLHAQDEENKEIHRRECNTQDAIAAEFAKVPLEEIRRLDTEKNEREAREQADQEQINFVSKFVRDNPWYVNNTHNRDVISQRINKLVQSQGRQYADWGEQDFRLAIDAAADAGELYTNGRYVRQSPDTEAMETGELRQAAIDQLRGLR
jgi:hypothetical protein